MYSAYPAETEVHLARLTEHKKSLIAAAQTVLSGECTLLQWRNVHRSKLELMRLLAVLFSCQGCGVRLSWKRSTPNWSVLLTTATMRGCRRIGRQRATARKSCSQR